MGHDVWLSNNTGNPYSQEHETLSKFDSDFWKFDWTKYALYDFPALVKEIRSRNGDKKITTIGHSQGTTQHLAGMALIPEWWDANISNVTLMAPCTSANPFYFKALYKKEFFDCLERLDVWVVSGPDWDTKGPLVREQCP